MLAENRKAEWEKRKFYAEKLAVQTDPSSERLMNIALKYLDNDFLQENFYRFKDSCKQPLPEGQYYCRKLQRLPE